MHPFKRRFFAIQTYATYNIRFRRVRQRQNSKTNLTGNSRKADVIPPVLFSYFTCFFHSIFFIASTRELRDSLLRAIIFASYLASPKFQCRSCRRYNNFFHSCYVSSCGRSRTAPSTFNRIANFQLYRS